MSKLIYGSDRALPTHASKVWEGAIFSAWQWEQELYDGSTETFEALSRSDTAHTIGVLPDERILLVKDEQPNREAVITPAGGVVEPSESPEQAAKREFREETGYAIGTLVPWHTYRPSIKVQWTVHAFIGRGLIRVSEPTLEAGERISLLTYTFDEFLSLGQNKELRDLVLRTILLEAQLDSKQRKTLQRLLYDT